MRRVKMSPTEDRWRQVLAMATRLMDVTDEDLAAACGPESDGTPRSRFWAMKRRTGGTRIRVDDVAVLAEALDVPVELFDMDPLDAGHWVIDQRSDLLRSKMRGSRTAIWRMRRRSWGVRWGGRVGCCCWRSVSARTSCRREEAPRPKAGGAERLQPGSQATQPGDRETERLGVRRRGRRRARRGGRGRRGVHRGPRASDQPTNVQT